MRIRLLCIGRLKDGPERELIDEYLLRARRAGAGLGWRTIEEIELAAGGGRTAEGERIVARAEGVLVRLDEHGEGWSSADLSARLVRWRDAGETVDFAIGGADGHGEAVAARARHTLAFGVQTWPHRLVRVMLAEQVYRAVSIAAGAPYHRE
jgi:23S rRNA (pseudouridine1915-N3)-methyltransferase